MLITKTKIVSLRVKKSTISDLLKVIRNQHRVYQRTILYNFVLVKVVKKDPMIR